MSTRSRIGVKLSDGKIKSIYCHFDGYPEGVGKTLTKHYNDPEKAKALVELGDIYTLGTFYDKELAKKAWKNQYQREWRESEEGKKASEMTLPYSERGEDCPSRIDEDETTYMAKIGQCWEEYAYLYKKDYNGIYRWHIMEAPYFKELD